MKLQKLLVFQGQMRIRHIKRNDKEIYLCVQDLRSIQL